MTHHFDNGESYEYACDESPDFEVANLHDYDILLSVESGVVV
jgi:transcriptional antiterminator Rof (Rho-off)